MWQCVGDLVRVQDRGYLDLKAGHYRYIGIAIHVCPCFDMKCAKGEKRDIIISHSHLVSTLYRITVITFEICRVISDGTPVTDAGECVQTEIPGA